MRGFYFVIAARVRDRLIDADGDEAARRDAAVFARKAADHLKRRDPAFSFEWFFGACGLDNWGEPRAPYPAPTRQVPPFPRVGDTYRED